MKVELTKLEECYVGIALIQMHEGNLRPIQIVVEEILNTNGKEKRQRFREEQELVRQHVTATPPCAEPDVPNGHHSPTIEFADDY